MPNAVSFSGLGSGIDFSQITESIINQRSRPIQLLQSRRADFSSRIDAFKNMNAKLIAFREAARALADNAIGAERTAASSNAAIVNASASASAPAVTTKIEITRLASAFSQASDTYASANTPALGTGATFELRLNDAAFGNGITIDATNNSLNGLRDAINREGAGKVSASVVDLNGDGTQFQLVLTSAETGARNRVELRQNSGSPVVLRTLNPPETPADYATLDAAFTINNLSLTRPTNNINDVVAGLTLDLKATGTATIGVAADSAPLKEKIKSFVESYNAIQDLIAAQYASDASGRPGGRLAGDPTLRLVQNQLRDAIGASATANGGAFSNLTDIGITRDKTGKLMLDDGELDAKLASSAKDVQALLRGDTTEANFGVADTIFNLAQNLSDEVTGTVQSAINGYQTTIQGIDKSIANQQDRLELLRASLQKQFAAVDAAIGQLNSQGTALGSIIQSLQPREG